MITKLNKEQSLILRTEHNLILKKKSARHTSMHIHIVIKCQYNQQVPLPHAFMQSEPLSMLKTKLFQAVIALKVI